MNFPPRANLTKGEINRIGERIRTHIQGEPGYEQAIKTLNEWRIGHHYPMHTFNMTLRRKAHGVDKNAIVARRLKRRDTIIDKVTHRQPDMRLSAMQDIAGVRAIVKDVKHVQKLLEIYTEPGRFPHTLKNVKNYIEEPKDSGYRGVHVVFEFRNSQGRSEHARDYDGLLVEMQLRTGLQHRWATAVEAIGLVRHEELKSSHGDESWLEFFQLMASVIAQIEDTPVLALHKDMADHEIIDRAYQLIKELDVYNAITGWAVGMNAVTDVDTGHGAGQHYVILQVDVKNRRTRLHRFTEKSLTEANALLEKLEVEAQADGAPSPVLVSVGDIKNLERAYPNYFLDIRQFLELVSHVVKTVEDAV